MHGYGHHTEPCKRGRETPHTTRTHTHTFTHAHTNTRARTRTHVRTHAHPLAPFVSHSLTLYHHSHTSAGATPACTKTLHLNKTLQFTHQYGILSSCQKIRPHQEVCESMMPRVRVQRLSPRNLTGTIRRSGTGMHPCHNCSGRFAYYTYKFTHVHSHIHLNINMYIYI